MKVIWGFCIAGFLLTGCSTSSVQNNQNFDWSANETTLTHQLLKPDTMLGSFNSMVVVDTTLIVCCIDTDPICTQFVIRGDSLLVREHFLRKGRGPGEALWYANVQYFPNDSSIQLFGYANGDNYRFRFPLNAPDFSQPARWDRQPVQKDPASLSQIVFANHRNFIAQRFDQSDEMFWYATPDTLYPLGVPFPDDGQKAGGIAKAVIYTGMLARHPTEQKFLYASRNSGKYVFLFTVDTVSHTVTDRLVLLDEYPEYQVSADGINAVPNPNSPLPTRCTVSKEYIFMLYIGGTYEQPQTGGMYSDIVRVYDWEGNPVRSFRLDKPISGLHTDAEGGYLYGLTADKETREPKLLRFQLPE